jgi:thiamine-monophosphate kinase
MPRERIDGEEAIIGFLAPLAAGFPGAFGLKDDCATIAPPPDCEFVVTTDALIEGVHFLPGAAPGDVAWKALAVNVSDLAAKGATPHAYLLSLALPEPPERRWLSAFADGLRAAQRAFGCHLAGGDTDRTPGPLTVSISAFGTIPLDRFVRRSTARPGDAVYVSGTVGDAALGLALRRDPSLAARWQLDAAACDYLDGKFSRPDPPTGLAAAVCACASAAMDISDGLVKDFARMCRASGVGGCIEAAKVPVSAPARAVVACAGASLPELLTAGEDYQVLATVMPRRAAEFEGLARASGTVVTRIGFIDEAPHDVRVIDGSGAVVSFAETGWDHFRAKSPSPRA